MKLVTDMPAYNYPAAEEVKTEDQEFKVILSYTVSWRLAWAILTVSKQKSTYTLILYSFFFLKYKGRNISQQY